MWEDEAELLMNGKKDKIEEGLMKSVNFEVFEFKIFVKEIEEKIRRPRSSQLVWL